MSDTSQPKCVSCGAKQANDSIKPNKFLSNSHNKLVVVLFVIQVGLGNIVLCAINRK